MSTATFSLSRSSTSCSVLQKGMMFDVNASACFRSKDARHGPAPPWTLRQACSHLQRPCGLPLGRVCKLLGDLQLVLQLLQGQQGDLRA